MQRCQQRAGRFGSGRAGRQIGRSRESRTRRKPFSTILAQTGWRKKSFVMVVGLARMRASIFGVQYTVSGTRRFQIASGTSWSTPRVGDCPCRLPFPALAIFIQVFRHPARSGGVASRAKASRKASSMRPWPDRDPCRARIRLAISLRLLEHERVIHHEKHCVGTVVTSLPTIRLGSAASNTCNISGKLPADHGQIDTAQACACLRTSCSCRPRITQVIELHHWRAVGTNQVQLAAGHQHGVANFFGV